jgi:hypothetical protein
MRHMRSPEVIDRYLRGLVYVVIVLSFSQLVVAMSHRGVPATHDSGAHFTYTYLFDRAMAQRQFPVRWIEWVRDGHGQPLFSFYQPGLYYLTQITHLVVPSLSRSLIFTVLVAWCLGSWFTFAWLRPLGNIPAAVAAIAFAFSPYLVLDVFVRGAYPEFVAIACAPGVLWSLDRSLTRDRGRDRLMLALLLAVMAVCHLPSLLIFSPIFAACAAYTLYAPLSHHATPRSPRRAIATAAAGALALGLSAFYVLPALAEIDSVRIREMTRAYYDFHQHFVSPAQWFDYRWGFGASVPGPDDQMSFQIGHVQWLTIGVALLVVAADVRARLARRARAAAPQSGSADATSPTATSPTPRRTGLILLWLGVVAVTLFLMTDASVGVWEHVPALAFLQFPWRLLMAIAVAASALVALLLARVRDSRLQAIAGLAVVLAHVMLMYQHLKPTGYHRGPLAIDRSGWRAQSPAQSAAYIENGYYPISVRELPEETTGRWTVTRGEGRVGARVVRDAELTLDVDTQDSLQLTINTPYFPGWTIALDGRTIPAAVQPESGFMQVAIPPGRHRLDARLTDTAIRRLANIISAGSLAIFTTWLIAARFGAQAYTPARAIADPLPPTRA